MTEENTAKLIMKYPKIFRENFYFEHGDGWYNIIDRNCAIIQNHIDAREKYINYLIKAEKTVDLDEVYQVEAMQSKEKFGGLRFYVSGGDEYCRGVITMMENISFFICEECGKEGELRNMSWMRTLCDKHYEEETKRKM